MVRGSQDVYRLFIRWRDVLQLVVVVLILLVISSDGTYGVSDEATLSTVSTCTCESVLCSVLCLGSKTSVLHF